MSEEIIPEGINEEVLIDQLDHEKAICESSKNDDDKDSCRKKTSEDEEVEETTTKQLDIPYPSNSDEDEAKRKLPKLKIDCDDDLANSGFKDLRNAGKFWKAAQMMGTRKGNIFYLMRIVSSGHSIVILSRPTEALKNLCLKRPQDN